jgi:hypothetical protein
MKVMKVIYWLHVSGVIDDTPKPVMPPPKLVPKEINRTGANKKTYFVCHERKYCFYAA